MSVRRELPAVGAPDRHLADDLLHWITGLLEPTGDPARLMVHLHRPPFSCIQHDDAYGRGVDEGLEVSPEVLFVSVPAGIGDDHGRLGSEHDQGLFVSISKLPPVLLLHEIDTAHALAMMADRGHEKSCLRTHRHGQAQLEPSHGFDVVLEVPEPRRLLNRSENLKHLGSIPHAPQVYSLIGSQP